MNLEGAKIYNEGVGLGHDCEERIRHIVKVLKSLSPSSEVSMRFVKSGHVYEGLLWGKANDVPIGVYNRGPSVSHVLDTLLRKVKKECLRIWKLNKGQIKTKKTNSIQGYSPIAMAG
jgi:hypothetical protein